MANVMLGFPNRIDDAVLSGGAWVESLPLDNLKSRQLARVARSIDTLASSSTFVVDLQQARSIRIIALVAHNISFGGRIHIEAAESDDFAELVFDYYADAWSGISDAEWDLDSLEWENDNFWTGTYVQDDIEGQTPISSIILPSDIDARYWRITIEDGFNQDEFIEVGRIFIGGIFLQPRINYSWGGTLGYEDPTGISTAISGAEFFDVREPIRVMRFTLGYLSEEEGRAKALELTRRAGTHKEIFVVADADDATYGAARNFMGRLRQLSALEQAALDINSMPFEIKELR